MVPYYFSEVYRVMKSERREPEEVGWASRHFFHEGVSSLLPIFKELFALSGVVGQAEVS